MIDDPRSDEALIDGYRKGDKNALNVLFHRYLKPLKFFLVRHSWFKKDHSYLDDVLQDIFLVVLKGIMENKFTDMSPNSFRKWLYSIAHKECIKQDERQSRLDKPLSQVFPDDEKGLAEGEDDSGADDNPLAPFNNTFAPLSVKGEYEESNYDDLRNRAEEILSHLSLEEQKLMRLLSEGKSYKEIQEEPSFSKYSLDYLARKVYLIRKKVYKLRSM